MTPTNWTRKETLLIKGEPYRFISRAKTGELNLIHTNDNRVVTMTDDELIVLWSTGDLRRKPDIDSKVEASIRKMLERPFETFPEQTRKEALRRKAYLRAYDEKRLRHRSKKVLEPLIRDVAEKIGDPRKPSARMVARWLEAWNEIGSPDLRDPRCIAPRTHLRGNSENRYDPEVMDLLDAMIDEHWLTPHQVTTKELHLLFRKRVLNLPIECREEHYLDHNGRLRMPSLRTVQRKIRSLQRDLVMERQYGRFAAERLCKPVLSGPEGSFPLETVEIDHTLLPVIVVHDDRKLPLGRPWITAAVCRYTRMIVGLYIGFISPSAQTAMLCLRNAILPKNWVKKHYPNVRNEWPCHGVMKNIVVDNGPEFHSQSFLEACISLDIDIDYCPARKPWYKGKIERWFRRVADDHLHKIPGTTYSNITERGDRRPEKVAIMTLYDLTASILKWIVDDYSQNLHHQIYDFPIDRWVEGVKRRPVSVPKSYTELDIFLDHVRDRTLTRKGVQLYNLRYCADTAKMRELINRPDIPPTVKVRVNISDLGSVQIQDWVTNKFISVPCVMPKYAEGLSLAEHEMIRGRLRSRVNAKHRIKEDEFMDAKVEINGEIKSLFRKKKLSSKTLVGKLGLAEVPLSDDDTEFSLVDRLDIAKPLVSEKERDRGVRTHRPSRVSEQGEGRYSIDSSRALDGDDDDDDGFYDRVSDFVIRSANRD